jgi:GTPase SAR1 family protein
LEIDSKTISVQIIDTAGQESFKTVLLPQWIMESDGIIICYDITSKESFESLQEICKTIWRSKETELDLSKSS